MVHNLEKFKQAAALMAAMTPAGAVAEFVVTTERGGLSVSIAADGTISRTFYAKPFAEDHNAHEVPVDMSITIRDISFDYLGIKEWKR